MKMKAVDEQKDAGPLLPGIKREPPFAVPDGYFADFRERLNHKLHAREKIARPGYLHLLKTYMAAAALLAFVVLSGILVSRNLGTKKNTNRFEAELQGMVELELYSISEETILEVMIPDHSGTQNLQQASPDDMIEYLLDENLDEADLLNTL